MIWAFVGIYIAAAVCGFVCFLLVNNAKSEAAKYRHAAEKIIREEMLDYSLKNPYTLPRGSAAPASERLMLGICLESGKRKQRLVFDTTAPVYIGRNRKNHIVLYDRDVSSQHGRIFQQDGKLWLQDLQSYSGITVRHGLFQKKQIPRGHSVRLTDGDRVLIRKNEFRIRIFQFDIKYK